MKAYSDQYKDPRWQKKRLEIMERDGFACRHCDSKTETLNVHHAYYKKGFCIWEYHESTMITLCEGCHKRWHLIMTAVKINSANEMFLRALDALVDANVLLEGESDLSGVVLMSNAVKLAYNSGSANAMEEDFHAAPNA